MRKSRISFSITKKSSKNEGSEASHQVNEVPPLPSKEPTLKPSSYYACRFCCKRFKSEKTYETHQKSKNHKKAVVTGSTSELKKSRSCAGCHQSFDTRLQLTDHCTRFSHMPLVQKTTLRNPEYGKSYTVNEQEDPFVSIKYYSPYYCEVCDLDCVSDTHYQDHVKGSRHLKALEKRAEQGSGVLVDLDTHEVDVTDRCLVIMNKIEPVTETVSAYYCGICDTDCRSELAYTEHVTSKDHQIRMDGHGQMKISCDLCCMTFNSENNHKMHLKSKKHANNEAARQRLLPLEVQTEAEKGESVQDLRNKIKRTLSPTLENFDKIKVNVATVGSQESAVRSVMVTDEEIETEEAQFMEMGKPNVGPNKERKTDPKKNIASEKKLKEDELERDKWAKKKEEDYARRKAQSEKSKELRGTSPRGRGRGGSQRRGRGRGRGRFEKDDKFSWVNPLFDENGKRKADKNDRDRDRGKERKPERKGDKRDSKSDRRERRRSYERDVKKRDSGSEDEYSERVILKKGEQKRDRSSSKEDDLRKVINKQRAQDTSQNSSDDGYEIIPTESGFTEKDDGQNSLVFDYGHKHMERGMDENTRETEARAGLKGFFGGALSNYFQGPGNEGQKERARQDYYGDQRSMTETPHPQDPFERGRPEGLPENRLTTEKTLLLELLKRQFPDIRYLTEQQGGLELMQRIFGEMQGKGYETASDGGSDGAGRLGVGDVEVEGNRGVGVSDRRGVTMVGGDGGDDGGMFGPAPPKGLGGDDGRKVYGSGDRNPEVGLDRRVVADDGVKTKTEKALVAKSQTSVKQGRGDDNSTKEKDSKFGSKKSPDTREGSGRKNEPGKSSTVDKRRDRGRSRSRSKERRRRSRSRSGSRGRSRYQSKYSSRKRSRSSSRDRSSSKRLKRTPSPARGSKKDDGRSSTKRKGSVSPKRGDKQKAEGKSTVADGDKKAPQKQSAVSQTKEKSKDAKEKVLAKWTVSNWSGKGEDAKAEQKKEDSAGKKVEEMDKKEKRRDKKDLGSSGPERRRGPDRGEEVNKQETNRGKRESVERRETIAGTRGSPLDKIFDDASDYEDVLDDENEGRSLKAQFEDDYDQDPEVERRSERVSEHGSRSPSRESNTARLEAVLAETMARLGRTVPRLDEVRKSIPLVNASPDADYDPYSYEERAFKAQEDISDEPPMSVELLTQLALHYERLGTGPPYPPVTDFFSTPAGMALSRQQTRMGGDRQASILGMPRSMAAPGFAGLSSTGLEQAGGIDPRTALPLRGNLVANAPRQGNSVGTSAIRGSNAYGGGFPGSRNSSALMYIQPTEEPVSQSRQLRAIPDERVTKSGVRSATSQASVARGGSDKNIPISSSSTAHRSLLETIKPTPRTISPVPSRAAQPMGLSGSSRREQGKKRGPDSGDEEDVEEDFTGLSDSDQYGNDTTTSKPLKSILKKQSKFPAVELPSQSSDIQVPISSGNLPPKNAVGAEYVVQNTPQSTGEQGRYLCQLCDVQFATLSAKNLHLRGPKHLAMFMKHKAPLIDEMIEQAMGGNKPSSSPLAEKKEDEPKEPSQTETPDLPLQDWRGESTSQEQKQTEVVASHTVQERAETWEDANKPRETEGNLDRGYLTGIPSSKHSREENEPRLYVDEKTGRFVQAHGYYSDSLRDEQTPDEYGERKYGAATLATGVVRKEEYFSRDAYDQLAAREKDLSRDEYGRLVSDQGYPPPRDSYDRQRERSPQRQEYGRPPARDTMQGDFGRLAPLRGDLPLDDYEYSRREKGLVHDDYRRMPTRELPLPREDYGRGLAIPDEYGSRPSRESYADDKDWRSGRPVMREPSGEQSRDWSYGEPPPGAKETGLPKERQPNQRVESGEPAENTQGEWPAGTREDAKKAPQKAADESWEKRTDETRTRDYLTPVDEAQPRELAEQRRDTGPGRYSRDFESRAPPEDTRRLSDDRWEVPEDTRRAPDDGYSQPSYRGQYDGGYGDRYSGHEAGFDRPRNDRREPSGHGYDAQRRGRGARGGRGGANRGRGFPKKTGFNRGQRQSWKGGQGRY